jgi:hypothetical protein
MSAIQRLWEVPPMNFRTFGWLVLGFLIPSYQAAGQTEPLRVCQLLSSATSSQELAVTGVVIGASRHGFSLSERATPDPCPGTRQWLFTTPSSVGLQFVSLGEVHISPEQAALDLAFLGRLKSRSGDHILNPYRVTLRGVFVRRRWPVILSRGDGTYFGWDIADQMRPIADRGMFVITAVLEEAH